MDFFFGIEPCLNHQASLLVNLIFVFGEGLKCTNIEFLCTNCTIIVHCLYFFMYMSKVYTIGGFILVSWYLILLFFLQTFRFQFIFHFYFFEDINYKSIIELLGFNLTQFDSIWINLNQFDSILFPWIKILVRLLKSRKAFDSFEQR